MTNEMAEQHVQNEVNETPLGELNTDDTVAGTITWTSQLEKAEIEKLKETVEEKKKYLYLFAEFDNFKRRI